jgi:hypothetical protein
MREFLADALETVVYLEPLKPTPDDRRMAWKTSETGCE